MHTVFAFAPLFAGSLDVPHTSWRWVALLLGILAVAAVGVFYVRESGAIGVFPRLAMALVRMAIVLTVAFLLLRPVWIWEEKTERPRPVVVLIDVSQSMDNPDPRPNPADQWRAAMAFGLS